MKYASLNILIISLSIIFSFATLHAQNYLMNGTPITDCTGSFQDSGGAGAYDVNENFTTTICSDQSIGTHIRLDFLSFDIGAGETFEVYDAATVDPDFQLDTSFPHLPFPIIATAANNSGCLTVVFTSDNMDDNNQGWSAFINCGHACQTVIANLSSSLPEVVPVDTGWIDICPGDQVKFLGNGQYPQDSILYIQSDSISIFEWTFGDGHTAIGKALSHIFEAPGGYIIELKIIDNKGCESTNSISQRVRVAAAPDFIIDDSLEDVICINDTILITSGIDSLLDLDILVHPTEETFLIDFCSLDTVLIPDGIGSSYLSTIHLSQFSPNAILDDINDFLSMSISIEHSYVGDLEIELTCPNGSSVVVLDHLTTRGSTNFGEPITSDNIDGQSNIFCLGIPYTYSFVNVAGNGKMEDFVSTLSADIQNVINCETGHPISYLDFQFPEDEYEPKESFFGLLGCPFNGDWTLSITDIISQDNGWVTGWCMEFEEPLINGPETFTPNIIEWGWADHPSIIHSSLDSLLVSPLEAGNIDYTFWSVDDYGCLYDTTLIFEVLPSVHLDCMTSSTSTIVEADFIIAPNPVKSNLRLEIPNDLNSFSQIKLFNTLGEVVFVKPIFKGKLTYDIDMVSLSAGVYYLRLRGEEFVSTLKKIVKQ